MDFEIDSEIKARVLHAIRQSAGRDRYLEFICLPDGEQTLLFESRLPGCSTFKLIGPVDLFGMRSSEDVTGQIAEAMAADVRWLRYLNRRAKP